MTCSLAGLRRTVERYRLLGLAVLVGGGVWYSASGALGVRSPLPGVVVLAVAVAAGWAAAVIRVLVADDEQLVRSGDADLP